MQTASTDELLFALMVENELVRVEQGPEQILEIILRLRGL